jgi:hypothetical protein
MSRSLPLVALLVALAACKDRAPPSPAATPQADPEVPEVEPNDGPKSAQALASPVRVAARFDEAGGDDWFRLDAAAPTLASVELSAVAGVAPMLEVFDGERNKLLRTAAPEGEGLRLPTVTCLGACLFRVAPGRKGVGGAYTLVLGTRVPGPSSEKEPNSRQVDAQPLALGGAIDGWLAAGDDEDWFLIETGALTAEQVLSLAVASPPGVRVELSLLRQSDQARLASWSATEPGQDLRVRNVSPPAAPESGYFLVLRSAPVPVPGGKPRRLSDTAIAYTLSARASEAPANLELEPNDAALRATPLDPAAPTKLAFLSPRGDVDWFVVTLPTPSIVTAEVSGVDKVDFALTAIDPTKKDLEKDNELVKVDKGAFKEGELLSGLALPAGDSWFRVEGAARKVEDKWVRDYENGAEPYTFSLVVEPDDGTLEREPNDRADKATPADVGGAYRGAIHPAGDVDVWKLDVSEPVDLALTLSPTARLDLQLVVRDADHLDPKGVGTIVGQVDRARVEGEERLVIPFQPGHYLVEVSEKTRQSNPRQRYTLTIK